MASLHAQFDGSSSSSVFSGSAFIPPTQSTQIPDPSSSPSKGRGSQGAIPLTVRQIAEAYASAEDKSNLTINGVDITSVNLLGMVMNKLENVADVSFTLDDGTGRIGICRWVNEASDVSEASAIRNGIYVKVNCHMKGFQGKKLAFAFSVRPVTNFNDIVLHYIECVYIHMEIIRQKVARPFPAQIQTNLTVGTPFPTGVAVYKAYTTSQLSGYSGIDGARNDIYNMVLAVFQEPTVLAHEHGLHVDEVVKILGIPKNKILDALSYLVDVGHIYSTIDECHFKSACGD